MKTEMLPCAEGVSPLTIAAWHDGALDEHESARIRQHMASCAACQAYVAEYAQLDAALRAQRVPEPSAHLWSAIRLARLQARRRPRETVSVGRVLGGVGALAAVALVVLGFTQILRSRAASRPHPTAAVTVTPSTGGVMTLPSVAPAALPVNAASRPTWRPVTLPATLSDATPAGIALSASDGETAYLCDAINTDQRARAEVWVTHNRGASWAPLAAPPDHGAVDFADCGIWEDALTPGILGMYVSAQDTNTLDAFVHLYTSVDAGARWRLLPNTIQLSGLATVNGKSYALRTTGSAFGVDQSQARLSVSADGLATWQPIDQQFAEHNLAVSQFWVRPGDGALLALARSTTTAKTSATSPLWQSTDGGAHWSQLSAPALSDFTVAPPVAGQPWRICGTGNDAAHPQNPNLLGCTSDGGRTWTARPGLRLLYTCTVASCKSNPAGQTWLGLTFAGDGALLSVGPYGPLRDGVIQSIQGLGLYRLPAGSTQWEYLSLLPGNALLAVTQPGAGVLWSYGGGTGQDTLSGPLGHTSYGTSVFTADYQP